VSASATSHHELEFASVRAMKKTTTKLAALKLKLDKETVIQLANEQLKEVVGGKPSRMTPSQCPTHCF